jgi:hypothetical protein
LRRLSPRRRQHPRPRRRISLPPRHDGPRALPHGAGLLLAKLLGVDLRDLGLRFLALDDHVAQNRVVEPECAGKLVQRIAVHLDVHEDVVGLVDLVDREGQLAPTPIFHPVDLAAATLDERAVAFDHAGDLIGLIRMNEKHDFVVSHGASLWVCFHSHAV